MRLIAKEENSVFMPPKKLSKSSSEFLPTGVVVPMITPFKGKEMEEVDHEAFRKLTNYLIENGVSGLMVNGTSGEFNLQNHDERKAAVRTVVNTSKGRVPVIAGVSETSTKNALDLALDAKKAGATALIATGPIYYRTDDAGLLSHFHKLIERTDLPLMIYNIPGWVGYNIPPKVVVDLVARHPRKVAGVKFTTNDLGMFLEFLRPLKDKISIMIGSDPLIHPALELGAAGAVVGSANVLPFETSQIFELFAKGQIEKARVMQAKIDGFTETMVLGTYPAGLKEGLKFLGLDCGQVRPPLMPLTAEEAKAVRQSLKWKSRVRGT
jgi:4-hydroxy-tetrahydrodipicolinate synthase